MGNYKRLKDLIEKSKNSILHNDKYEITNLDIQYISKLLDENKILRKIISSVRQETRLVRFSLGKPYNTSKKEIFLKFINIQNLVKGNYPLLSTDQYIDDLLRINEFIKR